MADDGFRPVIKAIRKWEPEIRKQLRNELRAAGETIAAGARTRADEHSSKISGTVKTRTLIQSRKAEVRILAGTVDVPEAGLLELGNKGSRSRATFRHPVFGDKGNWAVQPMHPYLAPEVERHLATVTKLIGAAIDGANTGVDL